MVSKFLHPNQDSLAQQLGIVVADFESAEAVVNAIEAKLGKESLEERSRWFVISVLRQLKKAKWATPNDSQLDGAKQKALAKQCLAVTGFATSLQTVTKDNRSKFRIVGFASSKNIERGKLATGTKAYKIAASVLAEAGTISLPATKSANKAKQTPAQKAKATAKVRREEAKEGKTSGQSVKQAKASGLEAVEKTVVGRRAQRRGYSSDASLHVADAAKGLSDSKQAATMSEEEFANLDAALNRSDAEIIQQNWADQPREDRWSRVLGVLAGVGFFVFVTLLFL
ncbi:MAG: hypothetical protein WDZ52_05870 [Pseudohongiellaceae bacterium]